MCKTTNKFSKVRNRAIDVALDCEAAHYRTVGRLQDRCPPSKYT